MPEPFETSYLNAILRARRIYRTDALPGFTRDLYEVYGQMILDIRADFGVGRIDASRAIQLQRSVMVRIEEMGRRLTLQMERAVLFTADLATAGHIEGLRAASQVAGVSVASNFTDVSQAALELMQARRGMGIGVTFRTLINRHIVGMQDEVVRFVQSAVFRGVSGRQGGLELAALMARDDPALLQVLGNLGARGGRTRAAIQAGVRIPAVQLKQAKTLLFDAHRIQVSETNHAYFESDRLAAAVSPVVELVRWTLSGRHEGLRTSPDVCDIFAVEDAHGFGPGLWHPETVPALPHPFDQCFLEPVLRKPEDWEKPKHAIPSVQRLTDRRGQAILEGKKNQFTKGLTPAKIKRQTELANLSITRASQAGGGRVAAAAAATPKKLLPFDGRVKFSGKTSKVFKDTITTEVGRLPDWYADALARTGQGVRAGNTIVSMFPDLRNKQPRGWPKGMTWKNVDGVYRHGTSEIAIAERYLARRFGFKNGRKLRPILKNSTRPKGLFWHEAGHSLDDALTKLNGAGSTHPGFARAYLRDIERMSLETRKRLQYFIQGSEGIAPTQAGLSEAFAELTAWLYGGFGSGSKSIVEFFPELSEWIQENLPKFAETARNK